MKWFLDVLRGMVIGLANVIPGVSGGTMMVSMGIYDKLIYSINNLFSRLAWISKRYYGSKVYWPYLYAANKDHIDNPSYIPVGTPIRIPKLTAADRDTTSAQFKQLKEAAEAALR